MTEATPAFRPIDRSEHALLVIDDNPASRYATVRQLGSAGFRTREASTGAAGLAMADGSISAVVLDIHLPDIDGFDLCALLRARPETARVPVLHLTAAYVTDDDKVRGLDSGADAYLTRPVDAAVLVATVQALVRDAPGRGGDAAQRIEVPRHLCAGAGRHRAARRPRPACRRESCDAQDAGARRPRRHRPFAERIRTPRVEQPPRRFVGRGRHAVARVRGADAAPRRHLDPRGMDLLAAHRAGRDDGGGHRCLAARGVGAAAPAPARSRAHRARRGGAGEPHEGRLHRGAVARTAHAAERHHELDARAAPARRHVRDHARPGSHRAQRHDAGADDLRPAGHVAPEPRQAAADLRHHRSGRRGRGLGQCDASGRAPTAAR